MRGENKTFRSFFFFKDTQKTHRQTTYFCKESLEEFPVLELDVVKQKRGEGRGDEGGTKLSKCVLPINLHMVRIPEEEREWLLCEG